MKYFILFLSLTYSIACSGEIEKKQTPENKMNTIETPSSNAYKPQANTKQKHISGNGGTHVSGGPSSSHISGQ